jgi:hypothetical protein
MLAVAVPFVGLCIYAARAPVDAPAAPPVVANQVATASRDPVTKEVVEFIVAHPELLAPQPAPVESAKSSTSTDEQRTRLTLEQTRIRAQLERLDRAASQASSSDNPFSAGGNPEQLRRRLAEIDGSLVALNRPRPAPHPAPAADEQSRVALGELLARVPLVAPPRRAASVAPAPREPSAFGPARPPLSLVLGVAVLASLLAGFVPILLPRPMPGAPSGMTASIAPSAPPAPQLLADRGVPVSSFPPPADPAVLSEASVSAFELGSSFRPRSSLQPAARRALCTTLRERAGEQCCVAGVTADPTVAEDGARVAAEIALCLTASEATAPRVLLIEAAFANPTMPALLGVTAVHGSDFAAQLERNRAHEGAHAWAVTKCGPHLHVLVGGAAASDLMLTRIFETCIVELRAFYDVIVIHGATTNDAGCSHALDAVADVVLIALPRGGSAPSTFEKETLTVIVA